MASFEKALTKDLFDNLLPKFGTPRKQVPVWDEGQKMFLIGNYESAKGNYYYQGVRFCDNVVIREIVGLYHTWTYIDSIEIYAFNGTCLELVQKRDYEKTFRSEEFVRAEAEQMISDYCAGYLKSQGHIVDESEIRAQASAIVDGSFKSFLDPDFNLHLTRILPQLKA
ncbi:MAG: hypothetical protein J1E63_10695 [Muribaculaceae bacterium]|nr:hypothetical protein [Muribaculaceae bacterium]